MHLFLLETDWLVLQDFVNGTCQISCFRVPSHAKETRMGHFGLTKTEKNCENGSILHTKRVEICIELSSYKACNHLKPAKTPKTSQNFAQKFNLANR